MRQQSTHTRDAALHRLARANRWLIAGSVALTALFTEVAAQAFPGRSAASPHGTSTTSRTQTARSAQHPADPPATLQPPEQAPKSAESGEASAPSEGAPAHESTPAPSTESAPQQTAPAPESSPPVVSGGS